VIESVAEFQEIGHSGGRVTFRVVTDPEKGRQYQISWSHSRPVPSAVFGVYALPQGVVVDTIQMGGIGAPWNQPPIPGCYAVFISSDSRGKFGHQCPRCQGYWRSAGGGQVCPYCGLRATKHDFLTNAQRRYAYLYCRKLQDALAQEEDGDHIIDMDAVADAAGKDTEKPPFYYAEESQQKQYNCSECGEFNDILGRFAYCSVCGTRNDLNELENDIIPPIRTALNNGGVPSDSLKAICSAFDTFVAQYTEQLIKNRPMRSARRERIRKMRFHDLAMTRKELIGGFDIDICDGLTEGDIADATRMFQRRHVYEHNGGEVDEKYLRDSGDTSVRLKQTIRETQGAVHEFANLVLRVARNLHRCFHDIFEPIKEPIERHETHKKHLESMKRPTKEKGGAAQVHAAKPQLYSQ
jgi:hypothetical protein